jgi:hypothetical protein
MHKHANNAGRKGRWHVEIRRPFPEIIKVFDFMSMRENILARRRAGSETRV